VTLAECQNHRTVEVGRDLWKSPLLKPGHPDLAAQYRVQKASECLQGWRLYLSGKPVPALGHPHWKKCITICISNIVVSAYHSFSNVPVERFLVDTESFHLASIMRKVLGRYRGVIYCSPPCLQDCKDINLHSSGIQVLPPRAPIWPLVHV